MVPVTKTEKDIILLRISLETGKVITVEILGTVNLSSKTRQVSGAGSVMETGLKEKARKVAEDNYLRRWNLSSFKEGKEHCFFFLLFGSENEKK